MHVLTKSLLTVVTGLNLAISGCGRDASPTQSGSSDDHGHSHGPGAHDHQHGESTPVDNSHDTPTPSDPEATYSLGSVVVAETKFAVSIHDEPKPSSRVGLDLSVQSGPTPVAVRFWIGDEAATGVLKSKADAHGDHFHGQVETPAVMSDVQLWIEAELEDGTRTRSAVPLP